MEPGNAAESADHLHRTIAICVDGSRHSFKAMAFYAKHVARPGDSVQLLSVIDPPPLSDALVSATAAGSAAATASAGKFDEAWHRRLERAGELQSHTQSILHDLLLSQGAASSNGGNSCVVNFHQRVCTDVGATLCQLAQELQPAALIVGSRGQGKFRRTVLGSVSDYVLHHCHVPTIVVPPRKDK